jgi:ankyrin repeat protein
MDLLKNLAPLAPLALEATKFVLKRATTPASELATEASSNNIRSVRSTLSREPSIDRAPALVVASSLGYLSVVDALLEPPQNSHSHERHHHHEPQKIDPDVWSSGTTPLLAAVENGHSKTAKLLLEYGAEPELCPKTGTTALQEAAKKGDIDIVEILLSFGAVINHANAAGDTALIIASRAGHSRTVRYLLENGAELDTRNKKGSTALSIAAKHDIVEVVDVLLREGADVRVRDKRGRTPLHRAVEGTWLVDGVGGDVKEEIVRKLIRAGADPNAKDASGKTAADRIGWLTGGDGLKRLLEKRARSWEAQPHGGQRRSRTF